MAQPHQAKPRQEPVEQSRPPKPDDVLRRMLVTPPKPHRTKKKRAKARKS